MDNQYGLLIRGKDLLLQRNYFNEFVKLLGIQVQHLAPRPDKHYTTYSEIKSNYFEPVTVGCVFQEHVDQKTLRTLGWAAELNTEPSVISVPYDLEGIQVGSLFYIPTAYDPEKKRLFRVTEISAMMIYPASLTCKLVLEYSNELSSNSVDNRYRSYNLLNREDD